MRPSARTNQPCCFGNGSATDAVRRIKEEKGNLESEALEKIGDMYQKGDDLPQNLSQAIKWYRKAAENGAEAMQVKLASLILQSQSGPQSMRKCKAFARKLQLGTTAREPPAWARYISTG